MAASKKKSGPPAAPTKKNPTKNTNPAAKPKPKVPMYGPTKKQLELRKKFWERVNKEKKKVKEQQKWDTAKPKNKKAVPKTPNYGPKYGGTKTA